MAIEMAGGDVGIEVLSNFAAREELVWLMMENEKKKHLTLTLNSCPLATIDEQSRERRGGERVGREVFGKIRLLMVGSP